MKTVSNKEKARAFDMLMSGKMNPMFKVYDELRISGQENWVSIIVRQACEDALRLAVFDNLNIPDCL